MRHARPTPVAAAVAVVAALVAGDAAAQAGSVHVAFGDVLSVESLNLAIALERARERGLEVQLTQFRSEDIAAQAVVNGQADVGVGAPYALIQQLQAPVRVFYQLSTLRFYPVVDKELYPDWQALDGQPFAYHSRGSGTEAMGHIMEEKHGIAFGEISYVPGSEVRAIGLLQGTIKATFVDIPNKNYVLREAPDRFHLLPVGEFDASDEALFARVDWLEQNPEAAQILVEELLTTWRDIAADPAMVAREAERLGLLADLPAEIMDEVDPYYEQAVAEGLLPTDGGGLDAAMADLEFYTEAGQIQGDPAELDVEDFWYLAPLEQALAAEGG